jgi:hypothetical protein
VRYLTVHMLCVVGDVDNVETDPFMMLMAPVEQWKSHYTVATVEGVTGSYDNYINVIIHTDHIQGLILDGDLVPTSDIQGHAWTVIDNSEFSGASIHISNGTHTLSHTLPTVTFAVVSYGHTKEESYGYPAAMRLAHLYDSCVATATVVNGDGLDNDCDNRVDEELCDGTDDDGDGRVDEDTAWPCHPQPKHPGAVTPAPKMAGPIAGHNMLPGLSNNRPPKDGNVVKPLSLFGSNWLTRFPVGTTSSRASGVSTHVTAEPEESSSFTETEDFWSSLTPMEIAAAATGSLLALGLLACCCWWCIPLLADKRESKGKRKQLSKSDLDEKDSVGNGIPPKKITNQDSVGNGLPRKATPTLFANNFRNGSSAFVPWSIQRNKSPMSFPSRPSPRVEPYTNCLPYPERKISTAVSVSHVPTDWD